MRRREFITLLGGAAAAWPLAALAQQSAKMPTIGYLGGGGPTGQRAWVDAFVQRLRELGWTEGRTVAIEYRWGEGRADRYAEIAAEFVRLKVDVILANGTEPAVAAKHATSVIPVVFPLAGDPIGSRLVTSLARPGGNVTGLSNLGSGLGAKRLELLREVVPDLRRLAVMANVDYSGGLTERDEIDAAARTLALEIISLPIRRMEDIAAVSSTETGAGFRLPRNRERVFVLNSCCSMSFMKTARGGPIDSLQKFSSMISRCAAAAWRITQNGGTVLRCERFPISRKTPTKEQWQTIARDRRFPTRCRTTLSGRTRPPTLLRWMKLLSAP